MTTLWEIRRLWDEDTEMILNRKKLQFFFEYKDIDYVACWYYKAAEIIKNKNTHCVFVSTNSITQGERVSPLWRPMLEKFGMRIDFAYHTFRWDSESSMKAHVHCVIIGFSNNKTERRRF